MAGTAPQYVIPQTFIASIEHPGVVRNKERGFQSLGGLRAIQDSLRHGQAAKPLSLQVHRNDPYRRPTFAHEVESANLLIRVTTPRRTGRKRKKSTREPFRSYSESENSNLDPSKSSYLLRSLRDNETTYSIEALGSVAETFRFRGLPDFQFSLMSSPLAASFKQNIISFDASKFKNFSLAANNPTTVEVDDMIPPPVFSTNTMPFFYGYNQNPYLKKAVDADGKNTMVNRQTVLRGGAKGVTYSAGQVPDAPDPKLPAVESLDPSLQKVIHEMRQVLEDRPIVSRRALLNKLGRDALYDLRFAAQYCAYTFLSGPWRDTLVRFGLDPRQDPEMRKYQTVSIKLLGRADHGHGVIVPAWRQGKATAIGTQRDSHMFNGKTVIRDGSVWQLCDITDPQLVSIINTQPRDMCDKSTSGWYSPVAFAKIQIIMRDKLRALLRDEEVNEAEYESIMKMPDAIKDESGQEHKVSHLKTKHRKLWNDIRNFAEQTRPNHRGRGRQDDSISVKDPSAEQQSDDLGEGVWDENDDGSDDFEIIDRPEEN